MSKEQDLKWIKDFSKINISDVCKQLGVDKSNLWSGKASGKNVEKVRETIEDKLKNLDDPDNELYNYIPRID